jgi:hypothetical protein
VRLAIALTLVSRWIRVTEAGMAMTADKIAV